MIDWYFDVICFRLRRVRLQSSCARCLVTPVLVWRGGWTVQSSWTGIASTWDTMAWSMYWRSPKCASTTAVQSEWLRKTRLGKLSVQPRLWSSHMKTGARDLSKRLAVSTHVLAQSKFTSELFYCRISSIFHDIFCALNSLDWSLYMKEKHTGAALSLLSYIQITVSAQILAQNIYSAICQLKLLYPAKMEKL